MFTEEDLEDLGKEQFLKLFDVLPNSSSFLMKLREAPVEVVIRDMRIPLSFTKK